MFGPRSQSVRILVRPGVTDMRKSINGLSVLVEQEMELNPLEDGAVFPLLQPSAADHEGPVLGCNRILPGAEATREASLPLATDRREGS
jgi:hypothetical protein